MLQHLGAVVPAQSASVEHVASPCAAGSHTFGAFGASDTSSQPSPAAVLHIVSSVQKSGQFEAKVQTLPPLPKLQHS